MRWPWSKRPQPMSAPGQLSASKLYGRGSASAGPPTQISLGTGLSMSGNTLSVSGGGGTGGGTASGTYASRPAAGTSGLLYYATDNKVTYRDNGASWDIWNDGPRAAMYPPFVPGTYDDEFDDGSFSGWTAVNSGSHNPTITESNDCVSMALPGSDAAAELHAYMKSPGTINTGNYVECCFRGTGQVQNFNIAGLLMADGTTYGAGNQVRVSWSPSSSQTMVWSSFTNYNTNSAIGSATYEYRTGQPLIFIRLVYSASNKFQLWTSPDGVSWTNFSGDISRTLTPTYAGFFITTWGGSQPFVWSFPYVRFG